SAVMRHSTSAPSLRWPSQISTADRATGRPINALAAKRPSSTAGVTASMAILGEASACSTDARSAIDHGSPVDVQYLAADIGRVLGGQIHIGRRQLGGLAGAPHRR